MNQNWSKVEKRSGGGSGLGWSGECEPKIEGFVNSKKNVKGRGRF